MIQLSKNNLLLNYNKNNNYRRILQKKERGASVIKYQKTGNKILSRFA